MFTIEELQTCMLEPWFKEGYQSFERNIIRLRLGMELDPNLQVNAGQLTRFSQAVLASLSDWENPRTTEGSKLCTAAGDIEAATAAFTHNGNGDRNRRRHIFNASLLYDIAGMPGTSASYAKRDGLETEIKGFLSRQPESFWGLLSSSEITATTGRQTKTASLDSLAIDDLLNNAIGEILWEFGKYFQVPDLGEPIDGFDAMRAISDVVANYSLDIDNDIVQALLKAIELRRRSSLVEVVRQLTTVYQKTLRSIGIPAEVWPAQRAALEGGLLHDDFTSFGIASPTGTGKTALTRLLLADFFNKHRNKKALYVSPSRALTSQIGRDLSAALEPLGITVSAVGAALTVSQNPAADTKDADLLVFTPEKADLLLRVEPDIYKRAGLLIVDEAHHIEQGTRGVLLEFYLWRLRALIPPSARIVQLSAVAPNMDELVGWLGTKDDYRSVKVDWRANRLRLGTFEMTKSGGEIQFENEEPFVLLQPEECPTGNDERLASLIERLSKSGIVLALFTSVSKAEKMAERIASFRDDLQKVDDFVGERLDARIERELYAESPLRKLYRKRVAYHHAQLPPRIRVALEQAITERKIDIVCATTTLSEGVNFPFSTVVVASLVGKGYELSPRDLWNIAGRAGRFGVDAEGHCILFEPSQWKHSLKKFQISDYLSTKLDEIPPVKSALATAITELKEAVDESEIDEDSLEDVNLGELKIAGVASQKARRIRGLLNVMRVGYAHASVSNVTSLKEPSAKEFDTNGLLAARQISEEVREFASRIGLQQKEVVRRTTKDDPELLTIAARIGWSLETQQKLHKWVVDLDDSTLKKFGSLVLGGRIAQLDKIGHLIYPLSDMMAEFEGSKLGGFTSYIAVGWLEGLPLSIIKSTQQKYVKDFGRLVSVIYSRVQYLLPWALFGMNDLIQYEAKNRGIHVGGGVSDLSFLASEGVPSFDALTLVLQLDIERVDATRLADVFRRDKPATDIIGWVKAQEWRRIVGITSGPDKRRLDPDLWAIWNMLNSEQI
ncbi:DEAD/DEAH box helicase [Chloroflexota bacterium]